jgi:phage gp36-like protein
MAYATVDDMTRRFGERELIELTDLENLPPSTIDMSKVGAALDDAQSLIDGYVGQVYRLPLRGCASPTVSPGTLSLYVAPPQLVRLSCDLARYYLYDDLAPENEVYRRFGQARKELEAISTGATQLSCPYGGEPGELIAASAQTGDEVSFSFAPRQITDESTRGY